MKHLTDRNHSGLIQNHYSSRGFALIDFRQQKELEGGGISEAILPEDIGGRARGSEERGGVAEIGYQLLQGGGFACPCRAMNGAETILGGEALGDDFPLFFGQLAAEIGGCIECREGASVFFDKGNEILFITESFPSGEEGATAEEFTSGDG